MKKCLSDIGDQHNFKQRFGWIQEFKTDTFSYIISKFGPNLNFDNPLTHVQSTFAQITKQNVCKVIVVI